MPNLILLCCNATQLFLAWLSMENSLFLFSSHQPIMTREMIPQVPQFSISLRDLPLSWFIEICDHLFSSWGTCLFSCLFYITLTEVLTVMRKCYDALYEVACILTVTTQCKIWRRVSLLTDINFIFILCTSVSNSNPALLNLCNHCSLSTDTNLVIRFQSSH